MLEIGALKEQDVNAHVMAPGMFNRLTENIRKTGNLESVPYCAQPDASKPIEIVSGHHRIRAARAAGLTHVIGLVDRNPRTRSEIIAKQLAHNALVGSDDPELVKRLVGEIQDVDALLESGLGEQYLPTPERFKVTLFTPHADYQWKVCTFTFLPHQMDKVKELLKAVGSKTDVMLVAQEEQFEKFISAVGEYARRKEILSAGTAVSLLIDLALRENAAMEAEAQAKAAVGQEAMDAMIVQERG
jgi:hypothetical protein